MVVFLQLYFLIVFLSGCATFATSPLHTASAQGDLSTMEGLLRSGADPNEHTGEMSNLIDGYSEAGWGGPPLQHAAYYCQVEAASLLIEKGADVNERGGKRFTALHRAAAKDCVDVIKILLEKGADLNPYDDLYRFSPLGWAAITGSSSAVKLLIERGADPEEAIFKLQTANNLSAKFHPAAGIQLLSAVSRRNEKGTGSRAGSGEISEVDTIERVSDVDELPELKAKPNKNSYALVIGIEHYRQKLPTAEFAKQDALLVTEYLTRVMGYPEENVITITDDRAGLGDFVKYFEKWLPNNVEPESTVFVYYSGHGAPNTKTGDAFLVPYDGDPSFIDETGYSLQRMYSALGKLPAKNIVVALDSCFSGAGGRSVIAKGSRPLVMNLQKNFSLPKNMTVLAASSGDQTSSTYDEKGHGLFTYFLLKGIKNEEVMRQDGSLKTDDLYGYLKPQVERIARKQYNNEQTPQLIGSR